MHGAGPTGANLVCIIIHAEGRCCTPPCLLVTLLGLGTQRSGFKLALALKLGVVQAAGVAESAGTIGATSPFGGVDSVAAVAAARGGSTAAALLDFVDRVVRLHALLVVHVDVVVLLVGTLDLGTLAGTFGGLDDLADLLEGSLDEVDVGEHLTDFAVRWQAFGGRLSSLLLLGNTAVSLGKVEDCAGVGADL